MAFRAVDEVDQVFGGANPNPDRDGCPAPDELAALARRERPLDDPGYTHVAGCSPCYRAMQELASPIGGRRVAGKRNVLVAGAAAAVLAAGLAGRWWWIPDIPSSAVATSQTRRDDVAALLVALDLRASSASRSDTPVLVAAPHELPRSLLDLKLLLPIGSEEGEYEVQVIDATGQAHATTRGRAEIQGGTSILAADLDLRATPRSAYRLAIRRPGEAWKTFAVELR